MWQLTRHLCCGDPSPKRRPEQAVRRASQQTRRSLRATCLSWSGRQSTALSSRSTDSTTAHSLQLSLAHLLRERSLYADGGHCLLHHRRTDRTGCDCSLAVSGRALAGRGSVRQPTRVGHDGQRLVHRLERIPETRYRYPSAFVDDPGPAPALALRSGAVSHGDDEGDRVQARTATLTRIPLGVCWDEVSKGMSCCWNASMMRISLRPAT